MWAISVVIANVAADNVIEMRTAETQEMAETFAFHGADPGLRECVRVRRLHRRSYDSDVGVAKDPIERRRVLDIPIAEEEPRFDAIVVAPHLDVARLLRHPTLIRVICAGADEHAATGQVDEEEHVGSSRAERRDHLLAEEVAGDQRVHVNAEELAPGRVEIDISPRTGRREDAGGVENPANRRSTDRQMKFMQLAHDSPVAPTEVLPSEPENQTATNCADTRATDSPGLFATAALTQPAAIGLVGDDSEDMLDVVAQVASDAKQTASVFGAENDVTPIELTAEHFDLGDEKSHPGVTPDAGALEQELEKNEEPAQHDDETPHVDDRKYSTTTRSTFWPLSEAHATAGDSRIGPTSLSC